ncbi:uncharacterized protein LOC128237142 isoform X2 [Mya arenaria]|uniref:uncharacterized protein LOC128237142 isoform X2 n=1 Tax=Mya arenaria TaxID=6604 RepID=UPI0022E3E2C6|nr:uncharacterized protein LOC128237142 isoform X2 [Mya arenaria]
MGGSCCCVGGCTNKKNDSVSLHTFPKLDNMRKKWIKSIQTTRSGEWKGPSKERSANAQLVCSQHFEFECFTITTRTKWRLGLPCKACLLDDALPTLFGSAARLSNIEPEVPEVNRPVIRKREIQRILVQLRDRKRKGQETTAQPLVLGPWQYPIECCIPDCSGLPMKGETNFVIHRFPTPLDERQSWINAIVAVYGNKYNDIASEGQGVCTYHFRKNDYNGANRCKVYSAPSVFKKHVEIPRTQPSTKSLSTESKLIHEIKPQVPKGCLTETNAVVSGAHWDIIQPETLNRKKDGKLATGEECTSTKKGEIFIQSKDLDISCSSVASATKPAVTMEAEPALTIKTEPAVTMETEPAVIIKTEPAVIMETEPAVTMETEPAVIIKTEPAVIIETEPAVTMETEPAVIIKIEPAVSMEAEPAVIMEQEPAVIIKTEPAVTIKTEPADDEYNTTSGHKHYSRGDSDSPALRLEVKKEGPSIDSDVHKGGGLVLSKRVSTGIGTNFDNDRPNRSISFETFRKRKYPEVYIEHAYSDEEENYYSLMNKNKGRLEFANNRDEFCTSKGKQTSQRNKSKLEGKSPGSLKKQKTKEDETEGNLENIEEQESHLFCLGLKKKGLESEKNNKTPCKRSMRLREKKKINKSFLGRSLQQVLC